MGALHPEPNTLDWNLDRCEYGDLGSVNLLLMRAVHDPSSAHSSSAGARNSE
jgi:hypothetical protein